VTDKKHEVKVKNLKIKIVQARRK